MNRLLLIFLALCSAAVCKGQDDVKFQDGWIRPNGEVNAIARIGNTVYIGGAFSALAYPEEYGTAVSAATGLPITSHINPNGIVRVAISDSAGGWYIGGDFTQVGGETRNHLARINADGSLNPWNPGADNMVRALALFDGVVYAGGDFTNLNGQARTYLAAIDATTGVVLYLPFTANGSVFTIAVNNNQVFLGGAFTVINTQTRNKAAAINIFGGLMPWNPNANADVYSIALAGNTVFVGGIFTNIGGQTRNRIAALDASSGLAGSWNPASNGAVNSLVVRGNIVYAGGVFLIIGGQTRNCLAAIDATSGAATAWNPNPQGTVKAVAVSGDTVYAAGSFTFIGGQTRKRIAAVNAFTGAATSWDPVAEFVVNTVAVSDNAVYIGGDFNNIGSRDRNMLAAIDITTGALMPWSPFSNGNVLCLAASGNILYAGGTFTAVQSQPRNKLVAIDATTGIPTSWNPNVNNDVYALTISNGKLYAGGAFTSIGGQTRNRLAAIDTGTGAATSWNPNANAIVRSLAISGNTVYAAGGFSTIGGQTRLRLAAIDLATGLPSTWNPVANGDVFSIVTGNGTVYAGGLFTTINGQTRNRIAAIDAGTGLLKPWNPNANDIVNTLALLGNVVYTGGQYTQIGGENRNHIAGIDSATGAATVWNPNASGKVNSLYIQADTLYAGGLYSSMSGNDDRSYFMQLTDSDNVIAPPAITLLSPQPNICRGRALSINFTASNFVTGNVFTAQLSNAGGSFASPVVLGTLTGTGGGVISGTVPSSQPPGSGYRIRVVSSSPALTGPDNGVDMTVAAIPNSAQLTITPNNTQTICAGATVTYSVPMTAGFSYQWRLGGINIAGATNASYNAGAAGAYSVLVTNASGCDKVSTSKTLIVKALPAATITPNTTQNICEGAGVNFSTTAVTGQTYQWKKDGAAIPGAAAASFTTQGPGVYLVAVTSINGCMKTSDAVTVISAITTLADQVELCAVTVDSVTGRNKLIWNKPASTDIDSFLFFRKLSNGGGFERIGAQAYSVFSNFTDAGSNADLRSDRYYIKAKNSCAETAPSPVHTTVHLSINKGKNDNTWNLIWNDYEGFPHDFYNIFRGTNISNMTLINTVEARDFNSYTDASSPVGTILYKVTVGNGPLCNPTAKTTGGVEVSSNIASSAGEAELPWGDMNIYPNPSGSYASILIQSNSNDETYRIRVTDITGRTTATLEASVNKPVSFGHALPAGVYFIEASSTTGNTRIIKRWVKE